jgi:hypothetical protein
MAVLAAYDFAGCTHARARAPGVLPYEAVPGGGRGQDLAEPLGEDGERAGRDVPVFGEVTMLLIARTSGGVSRYGIAHDADRLPHTRGRANLPSALARFDPGLLARSGPPLNSRR